MPIKGLTTQAEGEILSAREILPCFGKFFKGAKKNDKGYAGADLDYFRVEFEPDYGYLRTAFVEAYGLRPKIFDKVILTSPNLDKAFDTWYIEFAGDTGIMRHRCDGETIASWYDMERSQQVNEPRPCMKNDPDNPCNCTKSGRLFVILPDLSLGGYFTLRTGSVRDIANIYKSLAGVQALGGHIMRMYWTLKRTPEEQVDHVTMKNGETKRVKKTRAAIHLTGSQDELSRLIMGNLENKGHELLAPPPPELVQLPERATITDEATGEIVDDDPPPPLADSLEWDLVLTNALVSLTGINPTSLVAALNNREADGEITADDTLIDVFEMAWTWVHASWVGDATDIAERLLAEARQPLQPYQVHACVNDLANRFEVRGKATKAQVSKLVDELVFIAGYGKREDGLLALDTLTAFLFSGEKAKAISKKEFQAILGWWTYINEAGEADYYTSALDEIGLILECDTFVQELHTSGSED